MSSGQVAASAKVTISGIWPLLRIEMTALLALELR
jgi:hypothetical protein